MCDNLMNNLIKQVVKYNNNKEIKYDDRVRQIDRQIERLIDWQIDREREINKRMHTFVHRFI